MMCMSRTDSVDSSISRRSTVAATSPPKPKAYMTFNGIPIRGGCTPPASAAAVYSSRAVMNGILPLAAAATREPCGVG
jgi:hypothetical protein